VPFRLGPRRVESLAVVADLEFDAAFGLVHRDPQVRRLGMLQRVHDRLASDLVDQQLDRRW
jgi:hypothetical protein